MLNNKFITLLLITAAFMSCSKKQENVTVYDKQTPSFLVKDQSVSYKNRMESTPVVLDGHVYDVISNRKDGMAIDIYNEEKQLISSTKLGIGLASAMVYNNDLYVAGSTGWQTSQPLKIFKTSNLKDYIEVGSLSPAVGKRIFNSSLIYDGSNFVIATEEDDNGAANFHPVFYRSSDLNNWEKVSELKFASYVACPTIRYVAGSYYVFYLLWDKSSNLYYTSVSKSLDLVTWEQSNSVVVAPNGPDEGQNTSDIDLYELNGQVVINYVIGNQDSDRPEWSDIKKARYNGTLQSFVEEFFK